MENFKVAGIASGFDWQTMVDQLMSIERVPQQRLTAEKTKNSEKLTALATLGTKLSTLGSRAAEMKSSSLFNAKQVALADESLGIKGTASTSATPGKYEINVTKLATATKRFGSADVGGSMGDENSLIASLRLATDIKAGTFSVNGQEITVAATDTLQDVFDSISAATSGVVTASYDSVADKISLSSASGELQLGSEEDTSNFLSALKLDQLEVVDSGGGVSQVTSKSALGVVDLDSSIATSGLAGISGAGAFHVNGVAIDFDADTDSMSTLMARVNESGAGVIMSYDSVNDRFRVVNSETGAYAMPTIDSGNGLLAALGLTGSATVGEDMAFTLDGGAPMTSRSNTLDSADHGIEGLTISAAATGAQTITVSRNTEELSAKVSSFIAAYNDVQDYIQERTKIVVGPKGEITAGLLAGNRELTSLDSSLRGLAFRSIDGMTGDMFRLEHLGIDFIPGTSKLQVKDGDALATALESNLGAVEQFFSSGAGSFASRMEKFIGDFSKDSGVLDTQKDTLTGRNSSIDAQIKEMERRLVFKREALEASFIAMESAQSKLNNQSLSLASLDLG